ncbi:clip-associating protein [Anaeramoeba flamelloides]|uniref:Clip-associating protein n=1 Tax=Anaeramoeba flamelloides TaxID=1746091 RepID=A0ABQ8YF00_9EUKA|nr:clip-associating protein [Anaeramoeba flamelloides]
MNTTELKEIVLLLKSQDDSKKEKGFIKLKEQFDTLPRLTKKQIHQLLLIFNATLKNKETTIGIKKQALLQIKILLGLQKGMTAKDLIQTFKGLETLLLTTNNKQRNQISQNVFQVLDCLFVELATEEFWVHIGRWLNSKRDTLVAFALNWCKLNKFMNDLRQFLRSPVLSIVFNLTNHKNKTIIEKSKSYLLEMEKLTESIPKLKPNPQQEEISIRKIQLVHQQSHNNSHRSKKAKNRKKKSESKKGTKLEKPTKKKMNEKRLQVKNLLFTGLSDKHIQFEQESNLIAPLKITNEKQLATEIKKILKTLGDFDPELWEKRKEAMIRFEAILNGGGANYQTIFKQIKVISDYLNMQINDNRSQITRQACSLISHLARRLKNKFVYGEQKLFDDLITLAGKSKQVYSETSNYCIIDLIKYVHSPFIFRKLEYYRKNSKNPIINTKCSEYLRIILLNWEKKLFEKDNERILFLIQKNIDSSEQETRSNGRRSYWAFKKYFPSESDQLYKKFNTSVQRLIDNERKTYDSTYKSNRQRSKSPKFYTPNQKKQKKQIIDERKSKSLQKKKKIARRLNFNTATKQKEKPTKMKNKSKTLNKKALKKNTKKNIKKKIHKKKKVEIKVKEQKENERKKVDKAKNVNKVENEGAEEEEENLNNLENENNVSEESKEEEEEKEEKEENIEKEGEQEEQEPLESNGEEVNEEDVKEEKNKEIEKIEEEEENKQEEEEEEEEEEEKKDEEEEKIESNGEEGNGEEVQEDKEEEKEENNKEEENKIENEEEENKQGEEENKQEEEEEENENENENSSEENKEEKNKEIEKIEKKQENRENKQKEFIEDEKEIKGDDEEEIGKEEEVEGINEKNENNEGDNEGEENKEKNKKNDEESEQNDGTKEIVDNNKEKEENKKENKKKIENEKVENKKTETTNLKSTKSPNKMKIKRIKKKNSSPKKKSKPQKKTKIKKISTPKKNLITKKKSTPKKTPTHKKTSTPKKNLITKKKSTPKKKLTTKKKATPKKIIPKKTPTPKNQDVVMHYQKTKKKTQNDPKIIQNNQNKTPKRKLF